MLNRILVATAPEEMDINLFQRALALAQATGAELHLVSIITLDLNGASVYPGFLGYLPSVEGYVWQDYPERYRALKEKVSKQIQHLLAQARKAGVSAEFTQDYGDPGQLICELAQSWKADLVVVGSRGRKGLSELLLGSVSNYIMHYAPCSVMVVHPDSIPIEDEFSELAA